MSDQDITRSSAPTNLPEINIDLNPSTVGAAPAGAEPGGGASREQSIIDAIQEANQKLRRENQTYKNAVNFQIDEIDRLKAGKFTKEEVHNFCHNLHGTVSVDEFADGCRAEMMKLYGQCPLANAKVIIEARNEAFAEGVMSERTRIMKGIEETLRKL